MDLYELRQVSLGYDPIHQVTADTACSFDGLWDLLDAIEYDYSIKDMPAEGAEFIRRQLVAYAPVMYLWEIISLYNCLVLFAPD